MGDRQYGLLASFLLFLDFESDAAVIESEPTFHLFDNSCCFILGPALKSVPIDVCRKQYWIFFAAFCNFVLALLELICVLRPGQTDFVRLAFCLATHLRGLASIF